ncbi:MAG: T9SS type A sorting domain-containing protein [Crocinitomix sp.]|nr:T9SS type A sorting domain-containing protein [Crocinitomix sp.]
MKLRLLQTLVIFLISGYSFAQTPDPGEPGIYAVSSDEYDFGDEAFGPPTFPDLVEVRGSVHYPTDLTDGPFPVILILHGRHSTCYNGGGGTSIAWPCTGSYSPIPSYQGYNYLAEQLASHGYIVISVSANSISSTDNSTPDYGMRARGELLQHHLDLWNDWNDVGGDPFGDLFVGKLDMGNIGTMGHSRGGEGVIEHALYNRELGSPYGINAVLTLAPVDFNRPILNGIPLMNIAPYCDGDVSDLQGVHFYDDSRYNDASDTMPKHNLMMLGANHNFYNTVWTPGEFPAGTADDWGYVDGGQSDDHCGTSSPDNGRFDPEMQRNSLLAYGSAFFRVYIGGETEFDPILKVEDVTPPVSSTLDGSEIFMSYHPGNHKRVDVNRTDSEGTEDINTVGEEASENGLVVYDICGDDFGEQYCIGAGAGTRQEPHNRNGGVAILGLSQLEVEWNSGDDWYRNDVPNFMENFTIFNALQFRVATNFDTSPAMDGLNFSVELTDNTGTSASVSVADYSAALYFPPGDYGTTLPRTMHNTISIPIEDFTGIDLTDISYIRFLFNESANGGILISDLIVSSDEEVVFPPIAAFEANVTETCTGEITFTDNSTFTPTEWLWIFGDGGSSDEANPTHFYTANGTYTVSLTVTNDAGDDNLIETAYIVVDRPDAPVGTGTEICGEGDATVNAVGSGGGVLNWYDTEEDGTLLGSGDDYTEFITETTDFWVEESVPNDILSVGPPDNTFGSGSFFGANDLRGLFFNAYSPFILESVRVYADGSGERNIQILDGDGGTVIHSVFVDMSDGESVVVLNLEIDVYSGYYMKITGGLVDLFRINDGSPDYPYEIPGIVALTSSNVDDTPLDYYYFFFDWKIREPDCVSSRTLVTATVEAGFPVTISDDVTIASGETTTLEATGGTTYSWSPTTGLSDPDAAITDANPTETTTYTCAITNDEGCTVTAEVTVTIDGQIGVGELTKTNFEIHPNPSNGLIQVQLGASTQLDKIEVYTAAGKLVYNNEFQNQNEAISIDLSSLARGVYYVKLFNGDIEYQEKLILQ